MDVATDSFDKRKQLDVSYLDFSKAFDKVPHQRLRLQLKMHGIRGNLLNWIQMWLSGRQQRVILNGCKSEWKEVIRGVPQGSVLGPLLLIICVNTIENSIDSKVLKFADDVKRVEMQNWSPAAQRWAQIQARQGFCGSQLGLNSILLGSCWAQHGQPSVEGIHCWAWCWALIAPG